MKRLPGFPVLPLLGLVLAACGNSTAAAPLPKSIVQIAPEPTTAQAMKPFSFGEYDVGFYSSPMACVWLVGKDTLDAETMTVSKTVTIDSITPIKAQGLTFAPVMYATLPATHAGYSRHDSGTYVGDVPTPTKHLRDNDTAALMNWDARQPFVGATLTPGDYHLFITTHVPETGGQVMGWQIDWHGADGRPRTSTWATSVQYAKNCQA